MSEFYKVMRNKYSFTGIDSEKAIPDAIEMEVVDVRSAIEKFPRYRSVEQTFV
jgi:hypothetical protein